MTLQILIIIYSAQQYHRQGRLKWGVRTITIFTSLELLFHALAHPVWQSAYLMEQMTSLLSELTKQLHLKYLASIIKILKQVFSYRYS